MLALKKLQIDMNNVTPLAAKRTGPGKAKRRVLLAAWKITTKKPSQQQQQIILEPADPEPAEPATTTTLHDIVAEYSLAYKVADWGEKTPIHKLEPAENGTFNVFLQDNIVYNIFPHEYVSPKMLDTFGDEHLTVSKLTANTLFVQALAQVFSVAKKHHVMILDSPAGLTTAIVSAFLLGTGQPAAAAATHLHVPNPAFDFYTHFDTQSTAQCQKYAQTAFEWLRDLSPSLSDSLVGKTHFWLDYCCTFKGCVTQTLPQTDIKLLLHKGLLPRRGGLLGLTFSHRGVLGGSSTTVQDVVQWLKSVAGPSFGYKFSLCNKMEYSKITLLLFKTF